MSVKRGVQSLVRLEQIAVALAEFELFHWLESLELKGHLPFHRHSPEPLLYDTQPKTIREIFEHLGGAFLKLGQLLALRPDLVGVEFSREFEKLLEAVPPEPWEEIAAVIQRQVPGGLGAFATISHAPIASGSIAQVHRAVLKNGTVVAVKVKKPRVDEQFASDIALMRMLARRYARKHGTEAFDPIAIVEEFATYTKRELAMHHELRNMQRFAENFADRKAVRIPAVFPSLSSDQVLVMEFIDGTGVLQLRGSKDRKRRRKIAQAIAEMAYQQLFVDGFFHADLHAGNLFLCKGERIALLDYGIVGYVDHALKQQLLELFRALTQGNLDDTAEVLLSLHLGSHEPDLPALREGLYFSLGEYYGEKLGSVPLGKVLLECIETARKAKLKIPAQLVLFAKSVVTLEGVCAAIDPDFDVIASAKPFLRQLEQQVWGTANLAKQAKAFGLRSARALQRLPAFVGRLDHHLHSLDDRITDIDETFRYLAHVILRVSKLIVAALLLAAMLLTSALLIRTEPQWHGISVYTLVGAAISLVLVFLIVELMRRKP